MKSSHLIFSIAFIIVFGIFTSTRAQVLQDTINFGTVTLCHEIDTVLTLTNLTDQPIRVVPSGDSCGCWFDGLATTELKARQSQDLHVYIFLHKADIEQDTLSWYTTSNGLIKRTIIITKASAVQSFMAVQPINFGTVLLNEARDTIAFVANEGCDTLQIDSIALVGSSAIMLDSMLRRLPLSLGSFGIAYIPFSFHALIPGPDSATLIVHASDRWFDTTASLKIIVNVILGKSSVANLDAVRTTCDIVQDMLGDTWLGVRGALPEIRAYCYDMVGRLVNMQDIGSINGESRIPL